MLDLTNSVFGVSIQTLKDVPEPTFPFLQLPGEIRNSVYKLVIPHEERFGPSYRQGPSHPDISLLSTSIQLRTEACGVLYSAGILSIDLIDSESYMACLKWIHNAQEGLVSLMHKVEITAYVRDFRHIPYVAFQKCRFDTNFIPRALAIIRYPELRTPVLRSQVSWLSI